MRGGAVSVLLKVVGEGLSNRVVLEQRRKGNERSLRHMALKPECWYIQGAARRPEWLTE